MEPKGEEGLHSKGKHRQYLFVVNAIKKIKRVMNLCRGKDRREGQFRSRALWEVIFVKQPWENLGKEHPRRKVQQG